MNVYTAYNKKTRKTDVIVADSFELAVQTLATYDISFDCIELEHSDV